MTPVTSTRRLTALRRSHCDGCGCARCQRIDAALAQAGTAAGPHAGGDDAWLVEGRLVPDGAGGWLLERDGQRVPLGEALAPWAGHKVTILVGRAPE
jgi:hypothetical protein